MPIYTVRVRLRGFVTVDVDATTPTAAAQDAASVVEAWLNKTRDVSTDDLYVHDAEADTEVGE